MSPVERDHAQGASLQGLAIRLLGALFAAISGLVLLELGIDWLRGAGPGALLAPGREDVVIGAVSRSATQLSAMVLTFLALAIPLTANLYTPRLIDIFVRDRVNLAALLFFVLLAANALLAMGLSGGPGVPTMAYVSLFGGAIGFVVLIPYYLYVLHFLNPRTIIGNVEERLVDALRRAARHGHVSPSERVDLHDRILDLGNVILRAIDRADRNVSLDAIAALKGVVLRYQDLKPLYPASWYAIVRPEQFIGLSKDALQTIESERIWIEHKCTSQLGLSYNAALTKMKDAISAISNVNREIALHADARGDLGALKLCVRGFNTFIREAIKAKDVHAVYDTFHQYKQLAKHLASRRPELCAEIGRHFRYYAELARFLGLGFVFELSAYELGSIAEWAYERSSAAAPRLLDTLLAYGSRDASPRLAKALALLGAFFAQKGLAVEVSRVREHLAGFSDEVRAKAAADIASTDDPCFWEVTDRQKNLDYVEPERRALVLDMLAGGRREPSEAERAAQAALHMTIEPRIDLAALRAATKS